VGPQVFVQDGEVSVQRGTTRGLPCAHVYTCKSNAEGG
jgi:hypothetical protein